MTSILQATVKKLVPTDRFFASAFQLRMDASRDKNEIPVWYRDTDYCPTMSHIGAVAWIRLTAITPDTGGITIAEGNFDANDC